MTRPAIDTPVRTQIRLTLACNDPETGNFTGRVPALEIGDMEFEHRYWGEGAALKWGGDWFKLSGKKWPIDSYKSYFGNWCWDAVWFSSDVAAEFLNWLQGRQLFRCTHAPEPLYTWFNSTGCNKIENRLLARLIEDSDFK